MNSEVRSQKSETGTRRTRTSDLELQTPNFELRTLNLQPTHYCSRGFTLLEVLVASTILSMVLAILYGVFSRTLASKGIAEERAARSRTARIVLLRIGEDLQASFPFTREDARFIGETHRSSNFPESSLSFVTDTGYEGDWCEVAYVLVPDPTIPTLRQLVREVHRNPQNFVSDNKRQHGEETFPLLAGVQGLRFRFFDGRVWYDEWGREQTRGQIPQAVEVELYLQARGKRQAGSDQSTEVVRFSTIVDLPLAHSSANTLPRSGAT